MHMAKFQGVHPVNFVLLSLLLCRQSFQPTEQQKLQSTLEQQYKSKMFRTSTEETM